MAIKDLPKYQDIRSTIRRNGRYPYVGTAVKDTIVIHHSATGMKLAGSTPHGFANHHINTNKWHGCAYPFVITWDGTIYQCDDLDRRTYHAGDTNTRSIGICVAGNFVKGKEKPTDEQKMSLYLLVKELQKELPKLKRILGHQECPGYSWKNCPGDNWDYKKVISGEDIPKKQNTTTPTPQTTKPQNTNTYTVVKGDSLWKIATNHKTTVAEIKKLNNLGENENIILVGTVLKVPNAPTTSNTTTTKPVQTPTPAPKPTTPKKVVSKVNGLRFYSKPSWDDKYVVGTVNKGLGFDMVEKVKVGTSYQYKVTNSKKQVYYITASSSYVDIK